MTRSQLVAKEAQYSLDQKGAIVFVTDLSGTLSSKTVNITKEGYYYFDGAFWQPFSRGVVIPSEPWLVQGDTIQATSNTENIYQTGSVSIGASDVMESDYKFQVTGNEFINGNTRIGYSQSTLNESAQLDLSENNKGLLPNRVELTDPAVKAPITNAVSGMIVYNTTTDTEKDLQQGFYYWNGTACTRLVDKIPMSNVNFYFQIANVMAEEATGRDQSKMVSIPLSSDRDGTTASLISLPEIGSYAFNVKLYTAVGDASGPDTTVPEYQGKVIVYAGIWVNDLLQDVTEIFIVVAPTAGASGSANNPDFVSNLLLGCKASSPGDKVDIRIGYY